MEDSEMEGIYENNRMTKSDHPRPRHLQTAPRGLQWGSHGALVFLGLMCAALFVGVVVIGACYAKSISGSAAQLSSVNAKLTECHQTNHDQISTLMDARDRLNARLVRLTEELERLRNLSRTSGPCARGWRVFKDSFYLFSNETAYWDVARQDCRNRGAHLVIVNNAAEQNYISSFNKDIWIGLSDLDKEGTMKWVDGSPVTFKFWRTEQPDNGNNDPQWGEEDCVVSTTAWNDLSCSNFLHWVCEKELSTCSN